MSFSSDPSPRRRVLLLLSYHLSATEQGIMKYAREANWTLDLRTLRTGTLPESSGIDGILCLLGGWGSRPEMTEFVRKAGVPVVDMHGDEIAKIPAGRVLVDNLKTNPLSPALRSGPTAGSGASLQKQIPSSPPPGRARGRISMKLNDLWPASPVQFHKSMTILRKVF